MDPLPIDFTLSRADFLDLLAGTARPAGARAAAMVRDIERSTGTVTMAPGPDGGDPVMMWVGETHTTIAGGSHTIDVKRIKSDNTVFAVLGLLGLRRAGAAHGHLRWWRIRVEGAVTERIELLDRSPAEVWRVVDDVHGTRVEPTTLPNVVNTICDALEPLLPRF